MTDSLGSTLVQGGAHFSVFSSVAEKIELCFFDRDLREKNRLPLAKMPGDIWKVFVPGIVAGTLYGYRVYGELAPERGLFCNPDIVLLDPHARAVYGNLGVVRENAFDWEGDTLPRIPNGKTVIYETHVRGLTVNFPGVPKQIQGGYLALAHDSVIAHLKNLGVTTVELLPVHAKCDDLFLVDKGLTNYWGYSTRSFFAPEPGYASVDALVEFKTMVKALHRAGIEVILDVVYNHTAEMGKGGPVLSLRGFDNRAYYLFDEAHGFIDHTGCGNTLNFTHPHTRRFVLESLRYWADEMHVDGFRFDLAPALFRNGGAPDLNGEFARALKNDPVLSRLKLIAEPWDLGPDGYALAAFGEPWQVWNDRFRDNVRRFWRGDDIAAPLAEEITRAGMVNFVTCHDGFTLRDLVSYKEKHNAANREDNRDGSSENFSANYGHEGASADAPLSELRLRQSKNLLATLLFSRSVPMLLAGDEIGHSQQGNNNAYCQDNAITHLVWPHADAGLRDFIRDCLGLRSSYDWDAAVFETLFSENRSAIGFRVRFQANQDLVLIANASPDGNAVFRLPENPPLYKERMNTARSLLPEAAAQIFVALPRSFAVLEASGT